MISAGDNGKHCVGAFVYERRQCVQLPEAGKVCQPDVLVDYERQCGSTYGEAARKAANFAESKVRKGFNLLTVEIPLPRQAAAGRKSDAPSSGTPSTVEKWPKNGTSPIKNS